MSIDTQAPLAVVPINPDAELITACDRFVTLERAFHNDQGPFEGDEAAEARARPIWAEQDVCLSIMERLRASTSEGIHARAAAMAVSIEQGGVSLDDANAETVPGKLLAYLQRDVAELPSPASSDAVILAAAAAIDAHMAVEERECAPFWRAEDDDPDYAAHQRREEAWTAELNRLWVVLGQAPVTAAGRRARARVQLTSLRDIEQIRSLLCETSVAIILDALRLAAGDDAGAPVGSEAVR